MHKPIISIQGISKEYSRNTLKAKRLRDGLQKSVLNLFSPKSAESKIHALKSVSFNVEKGDVIGLVGRNGAGKTTLFRILSRITEPDSGKVILRGKVSSILEVGAGFHLDLSGRENIFLYGSILGMKKDEIEAQFNAIVQFSGVSEFLEMPVKHYSSGMYVRLGFAVASHVMADILLIDEVLAVGDAAFQEKCIRKIRKEAAEGRTIILASHNMQDIRTLCNKVAVLESGALQFFGDTELGLSIYSSLLNGTGKSDMLAPETKAVVELKDIKMHGNGKIESEEFHSGEAVSFEATVHFVKEVPNLYFVFLFSVSGGQSLLALDSRNGQRIDPARGSLSLSCKLDSLPLAQGDYQIDLAVFSGKEEICKFHNVKHFRIKERTVRFRERPVKYHPLIVVEEQWEIKR